MRRSLLMVLVIVTGCAGEVAPSDDVGASAEELRLSEIRNVLRGARVFRHETFDGNDRTCSTCHRLENNGTIDPEFIAGLPPSDPLFRAIDSDDGTGSSYNALRTYATVTVQLQLPPYLRPCDDLSATEITVRRHPPSIDNVALESVFNWDLAANDLETQASGAVFAHFEPGRPPTDRELEQLAAFQETQFSSLRLAAYAYGGRAPELPRGRTESERRGREHYLPDGRCGTCHSGPMLNELSEFHPDVIAGGRSAGERSALALVGTLGRVTQPPRFWCVVNPAGAVVLRTPVPFPDPGLAVNEMPTRPGIIGGFKIPTLWNSVNTAPYFHDGSALTVQEMMDHYNVMFAAPVAAQFGPPLTPDEQADAIAYLHLLQSPHRWPRVHGHGHGHGH